MQPIRSEILSGQRLEEFARNFAQTHTYTEKSKGQKKFVSRIKDNRKTLSECYDLLLTDVDQKRAIPPAGEWFLDNYHVVREQIKNIEDHLPARYYQKLPVVQDGDLAGLPRIYQIAFEYVAHTDSRLDPDLLFTFLKSFQGIQNLKMAELWAFSITLSAVLVENLRRIMESVVASQQARAEVDALADEILGLGDRTPRSMDSILQSLEGRTLSPSLIVNLLQRLRYQDSRVDPILVWLDQYLGKRNLDAEALIKEEHTIQTSANATVQNIILSLRFLAAFNWSEFFEKASQVDGILRQNFLYGNMDFPTRDRYRHRIERFALRSPLSEMEIAQRVVSRAAQSAQSPMENEALYDLGYHLLGAGHKAFEKEVKYKRPLSEQFVRGYKKTAPVLYWFGNIALAIALSLGLFKLYSGDLNPVLGFIYFVVFYFASSELVLALSNRITTLLLGPRHFPRYSLEKGIPESYKTFVVVPTMLTNKKKIRQQVKDLEIHYLSNTEGFVYYALLTDWADSKTETSVADQELLELAQSEMDALNEKYKAVPEGKPRFYLLHRKRLFNQREQKWMGWERKRGKLHEFNKLLLGDKNTSYLNQDKLNLPANVQYVLTLDSDTKIPRNSLSQLIGTMAHPLNRAVYDPEVGRVVEGYGILQPRVTPTLPTAEESTPFQKLTAGNSGVDPYASAVSDVYQDLFEEGSFAGKGIYDLKIFEQALADRVPENSLLSHDLFEGNFARCGFLSDVELFENFPSNLLVATTRTQRWTRGDWQLLPWILGRAGTAISFVGRWKMIENLRRSLVPIALFALFVLSLTRPLKESLIFFLWGMLCLSAHYLISLLTDLFTEKTNLSLSDRLHLFWEDTVLNAKRLSLDFLMLPFYAFISADAIIKSLYRMMISKKNMLQWTTAAHVQETLQLNLKQFYRGVAGGLVFTALALIIWVLSGVDLPILAFFILFAWGVQAHVALWVSSPIPSTIEEPLHQEESLILKLTARKIWHFFATFVKAEDNFLPPDNYQEDPHPVAAHRSSPTNFGMYLLSVISARDFGWIGLREAADRLNNTLSSMMVLPKFEGHFFNWYETTTTRPLDPRYISSVDNGNLAGHLIVVSQAIDEMLKENIHFTRFRTGASDTLILLTNLLREKFVKQTIPWQYQIEEIQKFLKGAPEKGPESFVAWEVLQKASTSLYEEIHRHFDKNTDQQSKEILSWALVFHEEILNAAIDFKVFLAWTAYSHKPMPEPINQDAGFRWSHIQALILEPIVLEKLPAYCQMLISEVQLFIKIFKVEEKSPNGTFLNELIDLLEEAMTHSQVTAKKLNDAKNLTQELFTQMNFEMLYDPSRKLFSIGMRVAENVLDPSYYDLMASEARLLSFIAIAKGDVPVSHWFSLGRSLVRVDGKGTLVSWSGSMFEYLMPSLVLKTPEGSMIKSTCELSVHKQIEYGESKNVPWGISESAYNRRDQHLTYQYSNFGVPDLALKRGVENDLVIAPYATLMASMYKPVDAAKNLQRLRSLGAEGNYGFYEAVDFTPARLREKQTHSVVHTYMAHHQGMSLVALANLFHQGVMLRRFHAEPLVQATELLLQERLPRTKGALPVPVRKHKGFVVREEVEHISRRYHRFHRATPPVQMLSNGDYSVMLTMSGSGYSHYKGKALTRWREDVTQDNWGQYIFVKNLKTGKVFSVTFQPLASEPELQSVIFAEDRVTFIRNADDISTDLEVFVSPENQAEVRRLRIINKTEEEMELEVTSYLEVILNSQGADQAHPSFSNLFIQTEFNKDLSALVASRRARSSEEKPLWMAHTLVRDGFACGEVEYETNRASFLGRGNTIKSAKALFENERLEGNTGSVLDPILSLRTKLVIPPGVQSRLSFSSLVADSKQDLLTQTENLYDETNLERISNLAWTQAQIKLHYLNIEPDEAHLFQRLAARLLFSDSSLRPSKAILKSNKRDQTGLWAHGISGDHPIIAVIVEDVTEMGLVRHVLKAQEFFANKGFRVDVVIINSQASSYAQAVQNALQSVAHTGMIRLLSGAEVSRGGVFTLRKDSLSAEEYLQVLSESRVVLNPKNGSLSEQLERSLPTRAPDKPKKIKKHEAAPPLPIPELDLFNGIGGFSKDGKEYVIVLNDPKVVTPAPWINVISNGFFGFQVSESGAGYTWSQNSRENQLTPWLNDPVSDPSGEVFYIYDKESHCIWSPTCHPIRIPAASYIVRHGAGYSSFEHLSHGIKSKMTQFVTMDRPIKISEITIENKSNSPRNLSLFSYVEWVLGFARSVMAPTTVTEYDEQTGMVLCYNRRNPEFGNLIAFTGFLSKANSYTCDRREFIGRNRSLTNPYGILEQARLSNSAGGGYDPCTAMQLDVHLEPNESKTITFVLGQADSADHVRTIVQGLLLEKNQSPLNAVTEFWDNALKKIQVQTPDPAFNLMINQWLQYQTMSCRIWARSAFYQAGGAFGFRDQLQDMMAVIPILPKMARDHLLRAASRQFVEGDVQHWWHPPSGRGVRTHFSDDLLWLPYVTYQYLMVTNDYEVLNETVPFLEGPLLRPDQEDSYYTPKVSLEIADLYEHCARALDHSLKVGTHGLPLMGCGDWNDGMNRVGKEGKGESVWLAWFLIQNLQNFAIIAAKKGDFTRAEKWKDHAAQLRLAIESTSWDGEWYRRAYYDDGTALGSAQSDECKIDSLAQTWAVISGAGDKERARIAMESLDRILVKPEDGIILLFTPPFDQTPKDPGYIKGYLPGVRENGGQYTHAASWVIIAHALLKNRERAYELFNLINPLSRSKDLQQVQKYKIEPYVVAGDVYGQAPFAGRGGWSWYTGAAGWLYRAGLEYILGFKLTHDEVIINPCVPSAWKQFKISLQHGRTTYEFTIDNPQDIKSEVFRIKLVDDGQIHQIHVKWEASQNRGLSDSDLGLKS
ncbi:GH36-type glycosyl hydrolase domain-containing protein [Bdellovibrio bacteriovorus]